MGDGPFMCGLDVCERRGYDACMTSAGDETGDDSYCVTCTEERAKCATPQELDGCYQFCYDLIRNNTIDEMERIQREINKSLTGKLHNLEQELADSQNETKIVAIVLGIAIACFTVALVVSLYCLCHKLRRNRKKPNIPDDEIVLDNQNQTESVANNDDDETCLLNVVNEQRGSNGRPKTNSTGCQTERQTQEAGTSTDGESPDGESTDGEGPDDTSTGGECPNGTRANGECPAGTSANGECPAGTSTNGECPAMRKLNNVPPTDDHPDVNIHTGMPENKHTRRRQQANGVTNGHVRRVA